MKRLELASLFLPLPAYLVVKSYTFAPSDDFSYATYTMAFPLVGSDNKDVATKGHIKVAFGQAHLKNKHILSYVYVHFRLHIFLIINTI
jgi:hypothetical protein